MGRSVKGRLAVLVLILLVPALTVLGTAKLLAYADNGKIPPGVMVEGIAIGGLTREEAVEVLSMYLPDRGTNYLEFVAPHDRITLACDRFGIVCDYQATVEQALYPREPKGRDLGTYHVWVRGGKLEIEPVFRFNPDMLTEVIWELKQRVDRKPEDARVIFADGDLHYIPGSDGFRLDEGRTLAHLLYALQKGNLRGIKVEGVNIEPRIKTGDVHRIRDLLSIHATTLYSLDQNRMANIERACAAVNGVIVMPKEEFSLSKTLGSRTKDNGYKPASVLQGDKVVSEVGGGICQVATTLYNAAAEAGLDILERKAHSRAVDYSPPGKDAAVYGELYDLRFRNGLDSPVMLWVEVHNRQVIARVFGEQKDKTKKIQLLTETTKITPPVKIVYDPNLSPGERVVKDKGTNGYRARTYKVVTQDGKLLEKTLLSEDYYRPRPTIIISGIPLAEKGVNK